MMMIIIINIHIINIQYGKRKEEKRRHRRNWNILRAVAKLQLVTRPHPIGTSFEICFHFHWLFVQLLPIPTTYEVLMITLNFVFYSFLGGYMCVLLGGLTICLLIFLELWVFSCCSYYSIFEVQLYLERRWNERILL